VGRAGGGGWRKVAIHSFLTSELERGEWLTSRSGRFNLRLESRYALNRKLCAPTACLNIWREENSQLNNRYTDCANPAALHPKAVGNWMMVWPILSNYFFFICHQPFHQTMTYTIRNRVYKTAPLMQFHIHTPELVKVKVTSHQWRTQEFCSGGGGVKKFS